MAERTQMPLYSQVIPKSQQRRADRRSSPSSRGHRALLASAHRQPPGQQVKLRRETVEADLQPETFLSISIPIADTRSRVEKFARDSAKRGDAVGPYSSGKRISGSGQRRSERPADFRSIVSRETAPIKHPYDRTPTDYGYDPSLACETSPFRDGLVERGIGGFDRAEVRDAIYENECAPRSAGVKCEVVVPDASNRVHSVKKSTSSHRMTGTTPNTDRRAFHCREWAFQKLAHALDQRPMSKTCGALILGDSGSGKTTFCKELSQPGTGPTARQQRALQRRMLAKHFVQGHNDNSLTMAEFIRSLVKQILGYAAQSKNNAQKPIVDGASDLRPSDGNDKIGDSVTPSAPAFHLLDKEVKEENNEISAMNDEFRKMRSTMERIHERDQYEDLMPSLNDIKISNESPQKKPPPRITNTNPFLPNFHKPNDILEQKLYENHENLFLRNISQQAKDCRSSKLYRQQSEPPIIEKKLSVFQKSLSAESKVDGEECGDGNGEFNSKPVSENDSKEDRDEKDSCDKTASTKTPLSPQNASNVKVSRIPVANFKYPNMSALSSAENSPSKSRHPRDAEKNSASDNSESNSKSSSKKSNHNAEEKKIIEIVDAEKSVVLEEELPEYQNICKPPEDPKKTSPTIEKCDNDVKVDKRPNDIDCDKIKKPEEKRRNKNENGDDVPPPIPSLPVNPRTLIANAYYEKLMTDPGMQQALLPHNLEKNPDDCFKKALLFPLLEIDPPKQCLFILVDSIDENPLPGSTTSSSTLLKDREKSGSDSSGLAIRNANSSKTIAELLANHHHLFPQWLLLVATAKKQSKYLTKMFTGFRKISLDDLRKNHVTLDVQRYILARLDSEPRLRQHVSRDAAQALDHLRIKSNGCFLYLERVLDGLADGSVALREIREIPGTLNGLYLWLCQRLFHGRKFAKVQPLLNVILAAKCGVTTDILYKCLLTTNYAISREDFNKRFHLLKRILIIESSTGCLSIFHHSFAEWLLDVKHCTRRFLCNTTAGHASLAMFYTLKSHTLTPSEVHRYVLHMSKVEQDIEAIKQQSNRDSKSSQEPDTLGDKLDSSYTFVLKPKTNESEEFRIDFHTLCLLYIMDSGCPIESSLRRDPIPTKEITDLDNCKTPQENSVSYSVSAKPGDVTEEVPELIADCFKCPTLPRDARVLRALLEMGASIESSLPPSSEQAPLEQSIEGTKTMESGEMSDGQMIDSMDIRASQISLEHLLVMEAEQDEEFAANEIMCSNEEALQLCIVDSANGRAPIHALAQAGDVHAFTLAQALQAYESVGGSIKEALEVTDRAGQTALQLAARGGRRAAVSLLLKKGASADTPDSEGWTPLRAAAWGGHTEVVELLLKHGCDVDFVDRDQRTALRAAAWSGHEEIVRLLISHGADVNRADGEGRTALIAAAYMGHTDIVAHLLDHGAHIDHADSDGRTALAVAALCSAGGAGSAACTQLLLERGAAPNRPDKDGMTPLLVAAFEGHKDVMELLLESEADPEASDKGGRTPLWAAAAAGHAAAVKILLFWGCCVDTIDRDGRTVLSVASAQGNVDVVRQLVDRGLDEHHKDNAGWTPLHYAAFEGHLEVCEVLLEAGAKIDEKDNDGKGPLMLTAQEGHCRLIEYLIDEWGAPVDQRAHDGKTALRVASLEGHYEAVRILLERGANVDAIDADQRSTLYILALDNRVSMARYLIQRAGADVEVRDTEGRTALHVSAWQGHYEMVNLLLTVGGCDVDARDNERRTPLHSASWRGQSAVVRLLLTRGADPQAECDQGATPLGIASQEGHEECVMWLLQHGANPKHMDRCGRTPAKVALRAGHLHVVRMLERWGATPQIQSSLHPDGSTNTSGSTAETRLCTASLTNNRLSPIPNTQNQAGSPDSKRRSVHSSNSTKSSSNLTSSTVSSSHHDNVPALQPPDLDKSFPQQSANRSGLALSFAQQVARCGRRSGRNNEESRGITSPLYATPPHSPLSDVCSPTQPPNHSTGLNILSSIAQQFGSSHHYNNQHHEQNNADTDRHFCRDTHMRIILGRDNKHSPTTGAISSAAMPAYIGNEHRERCRAPSGTASNGASSAGTSRLSCRRLVGSIGKIARRKKTTSPGVGGKSKRNGIVTNPAMRLVANVKSGLDSAAANLRRTGVALAASASSNNPAVKTNAFQWKKETPL